MYSEQKQATNVFPEVPAVKAFFEETEFWMLGRNPSVKGFSFVRVVKVSFASWLDQHDTTAKTRTRSLQPLQEISSWVDHPRRYRHRPNSWYPRPVCFKRCGKKKPPSPLPELRSILQDSKASLTPCFYIKFHIARRGLYALLPAHGVLTPASSKQGIDLFLEPTLNKEWGPLTATAILRGC